MNINIDFFQKDLIQAIGAGVYEISVYKNGESRVLYIGESVCVLERCASHLYKLNEDPTYFGFTIHTISDSNIKLKFRLTEKIDEKDLRKQKEIQLIKEKAPLTQSGVNDYQKSTADKVLALTSFLESSFTNR